MSHVSHLMYLVSSHIYLYSRRYMLHCTNVHLNPLSPLYTSGLLHCHATQSDSPNIMCVDLKLP